MRLPITIVFQFGPEREKKKSFYCLNGKHQYRYCWKQNHLQDPELRKWRRWTLNYYQNWVLTIMETSRRLQPASIFMELPMAPTQIAHQLIPQATSISIKLLLLDTQLILTWSKIYHFNKIFTPEDLAYGQQWIKQQGMNQYFQYPDSGVKSGWHAKLQEK